MKVLFLLSNGTEDTEFVATRDILIRAGIEVVTASINNIDVELSHKLTVMADTIISDKMPIFDGIIIPGGKAGVLNMLENETVLKLIKDYNDKHLLVSAICAAPTVLSKAGVLKNKKYTCYEGWQENISDGEYLKKGVVRDDNIITARSMYYSIDFGLEIVEYLLNKEVKTKVMKGILMVE